MTSPGWLARGLQAAQRKAYEQARTAYDAEYALCHRFRHGWDLNVRLTDRQLAGAHICRECLAEYRAATNGKTECRW